MPLTTRGTAATLASASNSSRPISLSPQEFNPHTYTVPSLAIAALEYLPAATLLTSTVWLENRTRRGVPILHDEPPKHDEPSFASTLLARSSPSQFPPLSHVTPFIGNLPITPAVPSCPASFNPNEYTAPLSVDTTV